MLSSLFADKLINLVERTTHAIQVHGTTFGLSFPSTSFWTQLTVTLIISEFFIFAIAGIVYHVVIPNRSTKTTTIFPYLIGFGLCAPLCIMYPFFIMDFLDIRNQVLRFCVCGILPIVSIFHCTEAMFNHSPHSVEASFRNYAIYYMSVVEIVFDEKTNRLVKPSNAYIISRVKDFGINLLTISAYNSIMKHLQYQAFECDINATTASPSELLHGIFGWKLLMNNLTMTLLLHLYLSTFSSALCIMVLVAFGAKSRTVMNNPLMMTTSPSDFWGRRWNLLVHGCLKRGVFKPVLERSSKAIALWSTFIASGLFHEYILICICPNCPLDFGKQTAFFIWNAIVVSLEHIVGKHSVFQSMKKLPKPVITVLVLSIAMPIAHWFLHGYTNSMLFEHGEFAFGIVQVM